ncbi:hypothetical protein PoB_001577800 [Plakobranchus ocellatus]|uniref:Uncharacterized protein n=1 Tax=Plakobranchus ocellatus TaxID=259542 RepID=A0AAV3Z468_9GAST|nr:hypothetical protein PoB_001577800 [Plakobranchus ocellatus]
MLYAFHHSENCSKANCLKLPSFYQKSLVMQCWTNSPWLHSALTLCHGWHSGRQSHSISGISTECHSPDLRCAFLMLPRSLEVSLRSRSCDPALINFQELSIANISMYWFLSFGLGKLNDVFEEYMASGS